MQRYFRSYMLQCSHFNNRDTYTDYAEAMASRDFDILHNILANQVHGHNFIIEVEVALTTQAELADLNNQYLIEDESLVNMLEVEWNNRNLTLKPEFVSYDEVGNVGNHYRVTAELMAEYLCHQVAGLVNSDAPSFSVTVNVWETPSIKASHTTKHPR